MADFGYLIGTLLASLAHARRITDEESVAIAEYYRDNPLLDGMSVPRVRVPELTIDLPVLINDYEEGQPPQLEDVNKILEKVTDEFQTLFRKYEIPLNNRIVSTFQTNIKNEYKLLNQQRVSGFRFQREHVAQIVDHSLVETMDKSGLQDKMTPNQAKLIAAKLRKTARAVALTDDGIPPKIEASIITAEVKEHAGSGNVVRLRLTMKEEGLEWDVVNQPDGTTSSKLSPE